MSDPIELPLHRLMHLVLWIKMEGAENEDERNELMQDLQVEEWRVQRKIEQRTRLVPREPGAPSWWYDDSESAESSQAAFIQLKRGPR